MASLAFALLTTGVASQDGASAPFLRHLQRSGQLGSDPFAGSNCTCETFCAQSCAINATARANMTLYRMTPPDVLGLLDKNTGDMPGDTSFILQRRTQVAYCRTDPTNPMCKALVIDDKNSTDVILEITYEVDGQWGPYQYCNPDDTAHPQGPWACTNNISHILKPPADFPPPGSRCAAEYVALDSVCYNGNPAVPRTLLPGLSVAACCAAAKAAPFNITWTYHRANATCETFSAGLDNAHPDTQSHDCLSAVLAKYYPKPPKPCLCERSNRTVGREDLWLTYGHSAAVRANFPAGGIWYSHPHAGRCAAEGGYVGDGSGCTWRDVAVTRAVNASCMYATVDAAVVASNPGCFGRCPTPLNHTGDCFLECYAESTERADPTELTKPWQAAFDGACPPVAVPAAASSAE